MALTAKQARFVDEYLIDLNATQAAIRASYSAKTAEWIGPQLLGKRHVAEAIAARMDARARRTEITQDRVLNELGRLAFLDIRKAFDAAGNLRPICELDDETAAAIAGLEVSEMTSKENITVGSLKKIRLSDKKGALELIGRHLGMWNDKLAVTGEISIASAIRARIEARSK